MKVLFWTASLPPNGGPPGDLTGEFLRAVRQRGVELTVVTEGTGPDRWHDVPVHCFPLRGVTVESHFFRVAEVRSKIRRIIRDFEPDLLHVNGIGDSLALLLLCIPEEIPYLVTLGDSWEHHPPDEIRRLFWHAGWVAASSARILEVVRQFEPGLAAFSSVIPIAPRPASCDATVDGYLELYRQVVDGRNGLRPDILQARYEAWARSPTSEYEGSFSIAGAVVRIRCQGADVLQAWSRCWRRAEPGERPPDLTMDVASIENPTTGYVDAPQLSRRWRDMGAVSNPEGPILACQRPGVASFYHRANRHLVARIDPSTALLPTDMGKPLLLPLLRWLADRKVRVFHATVMARQGKGVLLVGAENAGKSTALLSCLQAGWEFVADDLVVFREEGWVEGLYPSTWLTREHAEKHFPQLAGRLHSSPLDPKSLLWIADIPAPRLGRVPVAAALLVNRVEEPVSCLAPCRRDALLQAILPGSFLWEPALPEEQKLEQADRFLHSASTWRLDLGADLSNLPTLLGELLEK